MRKIKHFKTKLVVLIAIIILAIVLTVSDTGCLIRRFIGIRCPGCGMTTAVVDVLHLRLAAAMNHHPMVWSLPILVLYFLYDGRLFGNRKFNTCVLCLILGGFLAVWISRLI